MPTQRSRGNYCCHRIDKSEVEGTQVSQWYRKEVRLESECNSSERYRQRPSSSSNSAVEAPIEPQKSQHANHTATAEHRHSNGQRLNFKSGQSCHRKVIEKIHRLYPSRIPSKQKWLAHRNSVEWHDGCEVGPTLNNTKHSHRDKSSMSRK